VMASCLLSLAGGGVLPGLGADNEADLRRGRFGSHLRCLIFPAWKWGPVTGHLGLGLPMFHNLPKRYEGKKRRG
jgi:hypothetical protein